MGVSNMHSPRAMFSDTWCSFSRVAHVADLSVGSGVRVGEMICEQKNRTQSSLDFVGQPFCVGGVGAGAYR